MYCLSFINNKTANLFGHHSIYILFVQDAHETRHCAFCLKEISALFVKKCSGCERRAYCSEECKTVDLSISGFGQRHKNWCCRYEYGEEDIDWEVLPVANKGLGVVAKRFLPAGYRILVEQVYTDPNDHPGLFHHSKYIFLYNKLSQVYHRDQRSGTPRSFFEKKVQFEFIRR